MPALPKRPCSVMGCREFAHDRGRCQTHARQHDQVRGSSTARGYDSAWERLRDLVRAEEPYCRECVAEGVYDTSAATAQVDHIIRISERPDLRLARRNLQGLCDRHHAAKSSAERGRGEYSEFQRRQREGVCPINP